MRPSAVALLLGVMSATVGLSGCGGGSGAAVASAQPPVPAAERPPASGEQPLETQPDSTAPAEDAALPRYSVTLLEPLGHAGSDYAMNMAHDLNNAGVVVGWVRGLNDTEFGRPPLLPARWSPPAYGYEALPIPDGLPQGHANAINDHGRIGGAVSDGSGNLDRAVFWEADLSSTVLAGLSAQEPWAQVDDVNTQGWLAGRVTRVPDLPSDDAALWRPELSDRPSLLTDVPEGGRDYAYARAVNDAGTVAGHITAGDTLRPFVWTEPDGLSLLPLPTCLAGLEASECHAFDAGLARDINTAGQIVGRGWLSGDGLDTDRALVWEPDGRVRVLEGQGAVVPTSAVAINDSGIVVGGALDRSGDTPARLAYAHLDNEIVPLRSRLRAEDRARYELTQANGINEQGQIIAQARVAPYEGSYAVLLTPLAH